MGAIVRIDFWSSSKGLDLSSMYLTVKFRTSTSGVLLSAIRHLSAHPDYDYVPAVPGAAVPIRGRPKKWASPIAEINTMDIGELSAFVENHGPHPKIPSATLHVTAVSDGGLHNTHILELTRTILARLTAEMFGWDVDFVDTWDDDDVDGIAEYQSRMFEKFEPKYMMSHLPGLKVLLLPRHQFVAGYDHDDTRVDVVRRGGTMAQDIALFIRSQKGIYDLSHVPPSIRDKYRIGKFNAL